MGNIISPIKDIENIQWTQLRKGQVRTAKRILVINDGNHAIVEMSNGEYTFIGGRHSPNGNFAVLNYGVDSFSQVVLHGLTRIGVLDKKQVAEHIATIKERYAARERKHAMKRIRELCEENNIPVPTEAQE